MPDQVRLMQRMLSGEVPEMNSWKRFAFQPAPDRRRAASKSRIRTGDGTRRSTVSTASAQNAASTVTVSSHSVPHSSGRTGGVPDSAKELLDSMDTVSAPITVDAGSPAAWATAGVVGGAADVTTACIARSPITVARTARTVMNALRRNSWWANLRTAPVIAPPGGDHCTPRNQAVAASDTEP